MKTGNIAAASGFTNPTALDAAIVPPSIATDSLKGLVQSILDDSDGLLCIVVDIFARKVRAKTAVASTATAIVATIMAATGAAVTGQFTKDDLTKRTSTFTGDGMAPFTIGTGEGNMLQDLIAPIQPVISAADLIGRAEDAFLDPDTSLLDVPIVGILDQGTGKVTLVTFDTSTHAAASYAGMSATIGYDQTIVTSTTTRQPLE